MKKIMLTMTALLLLAAVLTGATFSAGAAEPQPIYVTEQLTLPEDFITGADISSLLSLEASGRVFYGFDSRQQDLLKTLSEAGVNYIRVRVWNDPFDAQGHGYGGGNCTVDTAIALGRRAAAYDMGLLVDFHYSDFWADPGKQQAPKAWQDMTLEEKSAAIYDYTADSISRIQNSGVKIGMVQVGNETTNGLCGETLAEKRYALMRSAAQAVRDTDPSILIVTHFTNPERKLYPDFARDLMTYGVDYDIFSTSYYPEIHGTIDNLKEQLEAVHELTGKRVMIAETSWARTSSAIGAYKRNVQGQADEITDCVRAMTQLGDYAVGVFYWEPAWLDAPGDTEEERSEKRDACGVVWATRYAGAYDPYDAGLYYGGAPDTSTSLFDPDGHPLESLRTFRCLREGRTSAPDNYLADPSFESGGLSAWRVTESAAGTLGVSDNLNDARDGNCALHFWSEQPVDFTAEQTVTGLAEGSYSFSLSAQGDAAGEGARMTVYAISDGVRYEQDFSLDGWRCWKAPMISDIPCSGGTLTVGVAIKAAPGAWGTIDSASLLKAPSALPRGDADGDGEVTILDATVIQRRLAGFATASFREEAADVNGSGLAITDATCIQRYLVGFTNTCRIGEYIFTE